MRKDEIGQYFEAISDYDAGYPSKSKLCKSLLTTAGISKFNLGHPEAAILRTMTRLSVSIQTM